MTSFIIARTTGAFSECSWSLTSTRANASRSMSLGAYVATTCCTVCRSCSLVEERRGTSARTTPGVHGRRCSRLARANRGRNAFHRARKSLGERLRGVVQRKAPRRALESRDLRHALGGAGPDRRLAPGVQPIPTTQLPGMSSTGPRGDRSSPKGRRGHAPRPSPGGSETMIEGGSVRGGRADLAQTLPLSLVPCLLPAGWSEC